MSEPTTEPTTTPDTNPDPPKPDTGADASGSAQAEIDKWKALARKHEDRAKENYEAAQELKRIKDSSKTDIEKAQERAQEAEAKAAAAELKALRVEIASRKGVPANLLAGTTEAELEASADELIKYRGEHAKPDFGGGERGSDVGTKKTQLSREDVKKLYAERRYAEIAKAKEEGRLDTVLGGK